MKLTDKAILRMVSESPGRNTSEPRPVQKHKRTQDWRAGPFRSSSPRGEPQIWGRVGGDVGDSGSPYAQGKTPSSNGMSRSRAETWIQARAAPGPERASPLRRGSPGLDSGPLGWPSFPLPHSPGQHPLPGLAPGHEWRGIGSDAARASSRIHARNARTSGRCRAAAVVMRQQRSGASARRSKSGTRTFPGIVKLTLSERTYRVELTSFALIGRHRLPPARRRKRGLVAPDDDALATNAVRRERDFARVHARSRIVAPAQEL